MKVSQEQKEQTKKSIINAASELVAEKGVKAATMQKIARLASIGEATIYNYFPTKEALFLAYYMDKLDECRAAISSIEDFDAYSLPEKLQAFLETSLELYLPDREFVEKTFKPVFLSFNLDRKPIKPMQTGFSETIQEFLSKAAEAGEIPDPVFKEAICQLYWEFYLGLVLYWLKDTSEQFNLTSQLIDRSLNFSHAVLQAGVVNKFFDLAVFLFRNHVLSRLDLFSGPAGAVSAFKALVKEVVDE